MDIISPEENIILEDEEAIVVLSLDPISKGHVVIKPKAKYKDIDELPDTLLHKILTLTQGYVKLLKKNIHQKDIQSCKNGGAFNDTGQFHMLFFQEIIKKNSRGLIATM